MNKIIRFYNEKLRLPFLNLRIKLSKHDVKSKRKKLDYLYDHLYSPTPFREPNYFYHNNREAYEQIWHQSLNHSKRLQDKKSLLLNKLGIQNAN